MSEMREERELGWQGNLAELDQIFAQLNQHDIDQFYTGYQLWTLRQKLATLQQQASTLRQHIAEYTELMQQVHPPAIALATLARLQANGVNDITLLERMLERGEEWLDRTMQRLDYCEQLDFISYDYTQWCENALEGAYDWIDSISNYHPSSALTATTSSTDSTDTIDTIDTIDTSDTKLADATEELLLQKLSSEEETEPLSKPETTLNQPAVAHKEPLEIEVTPTPDFSPEAASTEEHSEQAASRAESLASAKVSDATPAETIIQPQIELAPIAEEPSPIGTNPGSNIEQPSSEVNVETASTREETSETPPEPSQQANEPVFHWTSTASQSNTEVSAPGNKAQVRQQGTHPWQPLNFLQRLVVGLVKLIRG